MNVGDVDPALTHLPVVAAGQDDARRALRLESSGLLVVVPTCRPPSRVAGHLQQIARATAKMRMHLHGAATPVALLVLTSTPPAATALRQVLHPVVRGRFPVSVRTVSDQALRLTPTRGHSLMHDRGGWDTAVKRNDGLLAALRTGCDRVLFLDDDLPIIATGRLGGSGCPPGSISVARLLDGLAVLQQDPAARAAAWRADDFPDNSVLRHAQRLIADPAVHVPVSVGGGALLAKVDQHVPSFPQTYNEDWLFLLGLGAGARVRDLGTVRQDPYYPFTPRRARSEETGDVLAEGIVHLGDRLLRDERRWEEWVHQRRHVVQQTMESLRRRRAADLHPMYLRCYPQLGAVGAHRLREDALTALQAALQVHAERPSRRFAADLVDFEQVRLLEVDRWRDCVTTQVQRAASGARRSPVAALL